MSQFKKPLQVRNVSRLSLWEWEINVSDVVWRGYIREGVEFKIYKMAGLEGARTESLRKLYQPPRPSCLKLLFPTIDNPPVPFVGTDLTYAEQFEYVFNQNIRRWKGSLWKYVWSGRGVLARSEHTLILIGVYLRRLRKYDSPKPILDDLKKKKRKNFSFL